MARHRVLIVDDSKTAQVRLRKMLVRFDVSVDTSLSAEEALGYLSHEIPDVMFLDHHMEGMDGLEALRIIKANPSTAMIPVIMYTSEKGDVYVGQARALGALDILSKGIIKPDNLHRVLQRLNIKPRLGEDPHTDTRDSKKSVTSVPSSTQDTAEQAVAPTVNQNITSESDLEQTRKQVARLFELHITDVRQQITEHTKFIVKRLGSEIKGIETSGKDNTGQTEEEQQIGRVYHIEQAERIFSFSNIMLLVLVIAVLFLGYEVIQTRNEITSVTNKYADMVILNQAESATNTDLERQIISSNIAEEGKTQIIDNPAPETSPGDTPVLRTLDWVFENDLQFGFNQPPLGELQITRITNLIYMLDGLGFEGQVVLEIHFGNPCLQVTSNGEWQLARPELPVGQCIMYKEVSPDLSPGSFLSASYLALKESIDPVKKGRINIDVTTRGFELPVKRYPEILASTSAEDWNQAALNNNRVAVLLKGR